MKKPRRLQQRELELINHLSYSQLGISPRTFLSKWDVTYEQLASICHCSTGTVARWFARGDNYRHPGAYPCLKLKVTDWLLENYPNIPKELFDCIFPPKSQ
jgi:hypothetical protein